MAKRIPEEGRNLICKLYLQGESLKFIKGKFNTCDGTIYNILKENNITQNRRVKDRSSCYKKEYKKKYRDEHIEESKEWHKKYREDNKEVIREKQREYDSKHKEQKKEYNKTNKDKRSKIQKEHMQDLKHIALNMLGGCKCFLCGDTTIEHLTIDHIDNTGHIDRKMGLKAKRLYLTIAQGRYPENKISNLRVLCWNHNCGRRREYLDLPSKDQTVGQRYRTKIWKEAFDFFGPCRCGISDLKFLSISHINNDGAERRRKGEPLGPNLLSKFRQVGWPESLKEEFCLECFNHNCKKF
ncbi:MAG: hypothetical protein M0R80_04260 [Proteobacteria bacterium]|jgi:hypothetical protein|nr:hypothetical protein [Pseudomonadota bacterium]